jgi:site-specific DNA recombinase
MKKQSEPKQVVRCAVYTRKSTEEGLDQDFNSLDAQRESAEAYIKSQKQEGWACLETKYDDGGFTGGNMDRPALKQLMADIDAGKIDCVVVYKVDRLSRSLLDFARMMEAFEKHGVSFVSVTQQFNTATSMGRLVLNVLLSFAQFEREIISERTRDKIAAARRKGKWSGGRPVLGYDVVDKKLVINDAEVELVLQLFELYLEHQALMPVVIELNRRGWMTKSWISRKDKRLGGKRFTKNALYQLLTNPVYVGKVRYKKEVHQGEHKGIVPKALYGRVQVTLARNGNSGGVAVRNKHGALLRGLLHCASCNCGMHHTYASKGNKRYRYYVCRHAQQNGWQACPAPSVPAGEIERFVVQQIKCVGRDPAVIRETTAEARRQTAEGIERLEGERRALARQLRTDQDAIRTLVSSKVREAGLSRLAELQTAVATAQRRLGEVEAELSALGNELVDEREVAAALADFDRMWDVLTPREQSHVLALLVERVEYDGEKGTVGVTFHPTGIKTLSQQTRREEAA